MDINRQSLKSNAKLSMKQNSPQVYLVALVLVAATYVLSQVALRAVGWWDLVGNLENIYDYDDMLYALEALDYYSWWGTLLTVAINLMETLLSAGFIIYALNLCRGRAAGFGNLLDGFGMFFRIIGFYIVQGIFIYLWSLLLIIPGIIASYRYRMAIYLLIEHPEMSIMNCIRESKRIMSGRKAGLFVMDLSFIGWHLLGAIPFVGVYVMPYTALSYVNYYIEASGSGFNSNKDTSKDTRGDLPPWEFK